jgi:ubiquinone/menaquinone biosynthesis C-methylase UbiE
MSTRSESVAFDRVADKYDESRGGDDRGQAAAAVLRPWLPAAGTVLEVGVGTGLVGGALRGEGVDVIGVDISLPMLAKAHGRLGPRVLAGDAMRLPLRSSSVAAAYFVHVLHLVGDMMVTLREASRVVGADGRIVVICLGQATPTDDVEVVAQEMLGWLHEKRADEPERVKAAVSEAGLVIEHEEPWFRWSDYTAAQLADSLEARIWSWTWDLDDETWQRRVAPAIERIRALPDQDRVRQGQEARTVLVFRAGESG